MLICIINIKGIEFEIDGTWDQAFVKDLDGNIYAVAETGDIFKDGDHIGYLRCKFGRFKFISLMKDFRKIENQPKDFLELLFFQRYYGWRITDHPKEFEQFKRWHDAEHNWSPPKEKKSCIKDLEKSINKNDKEN